MTCGFVAEVRGHCGFCEGCDWIWAFGCLRFLKLKLVLGLWWCVTGFLPIGWSHEEPFMGFETFDLIDICHYILFCQPSTLISLFFFTYSLHYSFCIFLLILDNSLFVFFYFYFDTNVLYCTRINEIIFPLLVWTIWIVFKIMNEVYNLIDLR